MSAKLGNLRQTKRFRTPPPLAKKASDQANNSESQDFLPADLVEKAAAPEKSNFNFAAAALQFGLAVNTMAGGPANAQATPMEIATQAHRSEGSRDVSAADLVRNDEASHLLRMYEDNFQRQDFTHGQARESLRYFSQEGELFGGARRRGQDTLTPEQALAKLTQRSRSRVQVQLPNGRVFNVTSLQELQELDTFFGQAINPAISDQALHALNTLTTTPSVEDGVFREGSLLLGEQRLDSYRAYKYLTEGDQRGVDSASRGAAIGLLAAGAGVALTAAFVPGAAAALVAGGSGLAMGAGALAVGAGLGAAAGHTSFQRRHNSELAIRRGIDRGLKLHNLNHAVEAHLWLEARAVTPFTEQQQIEVANHFARRSGIFHKEQTISPQRALELLADGKEVNIPSTIPNHSDSLHNLRDLQILDTLRGTGVNPVLTPEVSQSLRFLESGSQQGDGLYRRRAVNRGGRRHTTTAVEHVERMSAFEAVDYLFRERHSIGVTLGGKDYHTETLADIQELNALQGDGHNTILPQRQFESITEYAGRNRLFSQDKRISLDGYEALQELQAGQGLRVQSKGRKALVESTVDLHEIHSLESIQRNDILEDRDFDLLRHWQETGAYRVDNDGEADYAYEALQAIQDHRDFEVASEGRYAPASHFQDLEDLATFEAPEAGFPNSVPAEDFLRLVHFQGVAETGGGQTTRADGRTGRAYEGYRELRDGDAFEVAAGGVWNVVTDSSSLHDLDAMLGRQVNDILPQQQYDLLKELADVPRGEGLQARGERVNSYAALQEFRAGRGLNYDFHGGDFGELLRISTPNLESLDETLELRDNQKDYDQYAYPVSEWRDKMERQVAHTPGLADSNLVYGQSELQDGQRDLRRGRSDLSDGERDLRRGRSDLRNAESDLRRARSLPRYTRDYEYTCRSGECQYEWVDNYNYRRDREISRARRDVSSAESDIRRARTDISSAESLIRRARRDISTAEGIIDDAEALLEGLPAYQGQISGTTEDNYHGRVQALKAQLASMRQQSHVARLDNNIDRQQQLIRNMETRPERPDGWEVPERLVHQ